MKVAPEYDFFGWVCHSKIGDISGIRDDAPEEAKKAYEEFMRDDPKDEYAYLVPAGEGDKFEIVFNTDLLGEEKAAESIRHYLESTKKITAPDGTVIRYNFHPEGSSIGNALSHIMGHLMERTLVNRIYPDPDDFMRVIAWKLGAVARVIYKEAKAELAEETGEALPSDLELRLGISECATINLSETLAEAMADYAANGEKANPLSIKMVETGNRKLEEYGG
jgi:hypothetical protein